MYNHDFFTRLQLVQKTEEEWDNFFTQNNDKPRKGEVLLVGQPGQIPSYIKFGTGNNTYGELPFLDLGNIDNTSIGLNTVSAGPYSFTVGKGKRCSLLKAVDVKSNKEWSELEFSADQIDDITLIYNNLDLQKFIFYILDTGLYCVIKYKNDNNYYLAQVTETSSGVDIKFIRTSAKTKETITSAEVQQLKDKVIEDVYVGIAVGEASSMLGNQSISFNKGTLTNGYMNVAAGEQSAAFGTKNIVLGIESLAAGRSNYTNSSYAVALGYYNQANGGSTAAIGKGCITGSIAAVEAQVVVGKYNLVNNNSADPAQFIVGIGTSDTDRKNALVVYKDGRASLGANPKNDMDIVTIDYLNNRTQIKTYNNDIGKYSSVAFGQRNIIQNHYSLATGYNITIYGNQCLGAGSGHQIKGQGSACIGYYLNQTNDSAQGHVVLGRFNTTEENGVLVVGIGTGGSASARKNGLVVYDSGRVKVGHDPEEDMDVVTKQFLDRSLASSGALPKYDSSNEGQFLRISGGEAVWASIPNAEDNMF